MFKKLNKKGFTLAELLVVVAIIGVLVAISIPIFTSQLEKSRDATDAANVRAAIAQASADYLTSDAAEPTKTFTYDFDGKSSDDKWAQTNAATMKIGGIDVTMKSGAKKIKITLDPDNNANTTVTLSTT